MKKGRGQQSSFLFDLYRVFTHSIILYLVPKDDGTYLHDH